MIFRNLDTDGDWTFGKGKSSYVQEDEAIKLNIKTRILSWLGDCFFAQDEGIDWATRMGSKNQQDLLEEDLRRTIIQTPDVLELLSFSYTLENRNFSAQYSVRTKYAPSLSGSIS